MTNGCLPRLQIDDIAFFRVVDAGRASTFAFGVIKGLIRESEKGITAVDVRRRKGDPDGGTHMESFVLKPDRGLDRVDDLIGTHQRRLRRVSNPRPAYDHKFVPPNA